MEKLQIVHYPHPTLRHRSKPIKRVDSELKAIVARMFELMYEARGIGLAANQVNLPFQLFVINTTGEKGSGEEMVFINPVVSQPKGTDSAEEGCLSIPGVNGKVSRPAHVHVSGYDLTGNEIDLAASGLLAKAIQHEFDHLQGVLFIDRISEGEKKHIAPELEEFELEYQSQLDSGKQVDEAKNRSQLKTWEEKYC